VKEHIETEEAARLLEQIPVFPKTETVALSDALNRILAEDCFSRLAVPPFDKSPFDGYACRAADTPGRLRVVGVAAAGCAPLPPLARGEAMRIFTGAPLPPGADAIVKQEDVTAAGGDVLVPFSCVPGQNVVTKGEDVRPNVRLIGKGTRLEPGHLGLLASQGIGRIPVYCRPRVVLIPTGSELFEPGQERSSCGIYNSSSFTLCAAMKKLGLEVLRRDIVPDDEQAVAAAVRAALAGRAQVVFTTGGASVGDFDFAAKTARQLGAEPLFWKVNMKPGGALMVSTRQDKLLVNLSGNPAAAMMSLLVVLRPWLERLCGSAVLQEDLLLPVWSPMPKTCRVKRLLRGHLLVADGCAWFAEHQGRGNGNLGSFVGCDLIGVVPGGSAPLEKGDRIRVLRLPSCL
jgi:molybdopterin molybdotransferase